MSQIKIGKTGLVAEQNGFGALPIQRISKDDAVYLLHKAYDGGMRFFDTAYVYTDSEEKLGEAFGGRWADIILTTKCMAKDTETFWNQLHESLRRLKKDAIDVYQFHNPAFVPRPGDDTGLYDAMLQAKEQGKIRFIGITNHRADVASEAVASGLYDTLQFPFSYLAGERDLALAEQTREAGMALIAMKALSGGLITNSAAAYAYISQFDFIMPIWGVQRESELDEFLSYMDNPPSMTDEMRELIERDKAELAGDFCRGCGYCMPCPQGIEINTCARASLLLRRSPATDLLAPSGQAMMKKIEDCIDCRQCTQKCPYGLDTPALLKKNYRDYQEVLAGKAF